MKKVTLSILASLSLLASEGVEMGEDFANLLEEVSDIATKKSMNVDYLPSVVTVIDAQTYIDAGIQNIGEALDVLPGIQTQISPMGYTMTTVRGFKNPNAYLSDKMKILVDGVPIYNEVTGSSSFYMDFPMLLVDKIEVLRGPGSTIYGEGAFYATINIITKLGNDNKNNSLYLMGGSFDYKAGGANVIAHAGSWTLFSDGYYQQNKKSIYQPYKGRSTDEAFDDYSLSFKALNGGFEFLNRFKFNKYGNFYGFEGNVEPDQSRSHSNAYFFSQLKYTTTLNGFTYEAKANYAHREFTQEAILDGDPNHMKSRFETVGVEAEGVFDYRENSHEENMVAELSIQLPTYADNDIALGAGYRRVYLSKDEFESSVESTILANKEQILSSENYDEFRYNDNEESAFWSDESSSLIKKGRSRDIGYAYAHDLISINDATDVVLGLRVDNYSDFGAQLSKRAALVYRASDDVILKALYGSAFRAPTFTEAYQNGHINFRAGDENLKPEETNTYELVGIYKPNIFNKITLNLFVSQIDNVIDLEEMPDTKPGYQNYKLRESKGVELEYNYQTQLEHNFYFNATYVDTDYTLAADDDSPVEIDQSMPDISKVMLKALYNYTPNKALTFGTLWRYYSETTPTELAWIKENPSKDSTISETHIFDETITYRINGDTILRLVVKNLFDADVRSPSYYYRFPGGVKREGRNFFVNFTHTF